MKTQNLTRRGMLLAMAAALILGACSAPSNHSGKSSLSTGNAGLEETSGTVSLSKGDLVFTMDCETTHFTVQNKSKGIKLSSVPDFESTSDSEDTNNRFLSELVLTYYDGNSQKYCMYSFADSVEQGNRKVLSGEDTVQVIYDFGNTSSLLLVPDVMTEEWYETVMDSLTASQRRRMKLYYTLYSKTNPPEDYEEAVERYPALKNNSLYLINQNLSDLNRMDIHEYTTAAGYTREDYEALVKAFDISSVSTDSPGFTVPVEYTLHEDGFSASVLFDQIVERSENYVLTDVELLPYFGATDSKENGWFLVPDGCGALIQMNTKAQGSYVCPFYGQDQALSDDENTMLTKNQYLPLFAASSRAYSMFCIVEGAAAVSELRVETCNASNPANNAAVTFHYRARYSASNQGMSAISGEGNGKYNLYRDYTLSQIPSVRYFLRSPELTETEIAAEYRAYLSAKDELTAGSTDGGILLDFYCVSTRSQSSLGISYTERTVLTTFAQIRDVVQKCIQAGVHPVSVRLCAYREDGFRYTAYSDFDFYKKIGTREELEELIELVRKNGGNLYLDADFQAVYTDKWFDGFSARGNSAYTPEEKLAKTAEYNVVTRNRAPQKSGYLVSPSSYLSIAVSFLKDTSLPKEAGLAYIRAGQLLTGSYSTTALDRIDASRKIAEVLSRSENHPLLIGGGNVFAARYATEITEIDMFSSCYDIETESIPFWQTVYHGAVDYSSSPLNTSDNWQTAFLKSVEYGSGLHYALIGLPDDESLSLGIGTKPYAMGMTERIERIVSECSVSSEYYHAVADCEIVSHRCLADGVYQTVFSDGSSVTVNYSQKAFTGREGETAPMSFSFLKGGNR